MGKHTSDEKEPKRKKIDKNKEKNKKVKNENEDKKSLKKKEKKDRQKKEGKISKIGIVCRIILLLSSIFLLYEANRTNMIPLKYMAATIALILGINLIFLVVLLKNKKEAVIKVIASILTLAISGLFIYGGLTIRQGNELLNNMDIKHKTLNFSVLVEADSKYQTLDDLTGKSMGYFKNDAEGMAESVDKIENENKEIVLIAYDNLQEMAKDLLSNNIDSILIEDSYKSIITDSDKEEADIEDEEETEVNQVTKKNTKTTKKENKTEEVSLDNFEEETRVIYTFSIDLELVEFVKDVSVTEKTFNVYISGIDTYGNIASVSRSDVNIVATINPETKQVLLTSIPRDYYVQLHGTTGYRDKLTHAGIYGVDKSVSTIEDLLDIEINYYFKFNFTSVIDIVNKIGGVDVYSDYDFTSKDGYRYKKGYNHVTGKSALSFVRERKAFRDGDRQRGKNQQAMIDAVAHKCLTPKILTKYTDLLNSLKKSFVTNMPAERITSLVKMQLDEGGDWTITATSLTGKDSKQYTYSYSGAPLYVMLPYQDSIDEAKALIQKVVDGEKLDGSYRTSGGKVHTVVQMYLPKIKEEDEEEEENETENTTNTTNEIDENLVTNETDENLISNETDENLISNETEEDDENKTEPEPEPTPDPEPEPEPEPEPTPDPEPEPTPDPEPTPGAE